MDNNSNQLSDPSHQQNQQQLDMFWTYQRQEIDRLTDFRNHQLPLARIKKIMKADEDVRMISAEAPVLFSKACELFILELTIRSWNHAQENKRRTLQKSDIAAAIAGYQFFDFLVDIVPPEEEGTVVNGVMWSYPVGGMINGQNGNGVFNMPMPLPSSAWQSVWDAPEEDSYVLQGNGDGRRWRWRVGNRKSYG